MKPKEKAIFLAGLFMGRGGFAINSSNPRYLSFRIKFATNNKDYLMELRRLLNEFKVRYMIDKYNTLWVIEKESIVKFIGLVKPYVTTRWEEIKKFEQAMMDYETIIVQRRNERRNKLPDEKTTEIFDSFKKRGKDENKN